MTLLAVQLRREPQLQPDEPVFLGAPEPRHGAVVERVGRLQHRQNPLTDGVQVVGEAGLSVRRDVVLEGCRDARLRNRVVACREPLRDEFVRDAGVEPGALGKDELRFDGAVEVLVGASLGPTAHFLFGVSLHVFPLDQYGEDWHG
jgi:hypothetical protein